MRSATPPVAPPTSSAAIRLQRPAPGFQLAFLSIPCFLEALLRTPLEESFRTAPPRFFAVGDFREPFLGPEEIVTLNRFKALKKQVEWMAGRYAAKYLLRHCHNGRPPLEEIRVAYRTKGAPYIVDAPKLSLSISHSQDYALAGLGLAPAATLGLDLEYIRPASRRLLLQTAFSDREAADAAHRDDAALFMRWTAKEAYLKYIGMGFHESLKQVEILDAVIWHHGRPLPHLNLHSHLPFPGYACSIVYT